MKLVVFGATGGIGSKVVEQALAEGMEVTAVARHPSAITLRHDCLQVIQGDVLNPGWLHKAIAGQDAVISGIGVRHLRPTTVYSAGIRNILQAMQVCSVRRILCVSASGLDPGPLWQRWIAKPLLWFFLKNMYTDLVSMETEVQAYDLDWTIIRPPLLTNGPPTGRHHAAVNQPLSRGFSISRADVADYMIEHLSDTKVYHAIVELAG